MTNVQVKPEYDFGEAEEKLVRCNCGWSTQMRVVFDEDAIITDRGCAYCPDIQIRSISSQNEYITIDPVRRNQWRDTSQSSQKATSKSSIASGIVEKPSKSQE